MHSTFNDLLNPHGNCNNWKIRKTHLLEAQCEIFACFDPILENRWRMMIMKVIGEELLAQRCTNQWIFAAAMEELKTWTVWICSVFASKSFNRTSTSPTYEDSNKNLQEQPWIIEELIKNAYVKMEKKWENLWDFFDWIWKSDYSPWFC